MQLSRRPGGAEFVAFCNEVIRATCWASGIPQSQVFTTLRTDAKDGGVDTRVGMGSPADKLGYFQTPSIWQFKAGNGAKISAAKVGKEVNKPYARKCIQNGDAYRICICGHLTAQKREGLESAANDAIESINHSAPLAKVLGVEEVVVLANSYPALVMQYRPRLPQLCTLFERWSESATRVTPKFVASTTFDVTKAEILSHVRFENPAQNPVITFHGASGVGKTRTVFQCLRDESGARSMVLYCDNEDTVDELATMLWNDSFRGRVGTLG